MSWLSEITMVILLLIIIKIIIQKVKENKRKQPSINKKERIQKNDNININQYKKKNFLTITEKNFLSILNELKKYDLIIIPQVNLATVIQKGGEFHYQNELYRNIDFGIFDKYYNILLLIELNDISHQQNKRWKRDLKVKGIVEQANIKLMTFYTNKPNKPEYVIGRILNELKIFIPNYEESQIKKNTKLIEPIEDEDCPDKNHEIDVNQGPLENKHT